LAARHHPIALGIGRARIAEGADAAAATRADGIVLHGAGNLARPRSGTGARRREARARTSRTPAFAIADDPEAGAARFAGIGKCLAIPSAFRTDRRIFTRAETFAGRRKAGTGPMRRRSFDNGTGANEGNQRKNGGRRDAASQLLVHNLLSSPRPLDTS